MNFGKPEWMRTSGAVLAIAVLAGGGLSGMVLAEDSGGSPISLMVEPMSRAEEGRPIQFTLTLDAAPSLPIRYHYQTQDGTAVSGEDYAPTKGKVVFQAGERTKTITVQTLTDDINEWPFEKFELKLSKPRVKTDSKGWRKPALLFLPRRLPKRLILTGVIDDPTPSDDSSTCLIWPNC